MGDILDYVLFNWRWFAGPLVLAAIVLGLLYKWNLTMDALAGAIGGFVGIMWADLSFVYVAALVINAVLSSAERGWHLLVPIVFIAALTKLALLLYGGVGGCALGIGVSRWRRWKSSRDRSARSQLHVCSNE